MRAPQVIAAALAALACAAARDRTGELPRAPGAASAAPGSRPPELALEAPARVSRSMGAVQIEVRLRNVGPRDVTVLPDPWLAEIELRGPAGAVGCAPAEARARSLDPVELAPGHDLPLRIDVSARCDVSAPGEYSLDVAFPGAGRPRATTRIVVEPRTWKNPGPR